MSRLAKPENWHGVWTALVTPLKKAGESVELDTESLKKLMEAQIAAGLRGLVIAGSTGEGSLLPDAVYEKLLQSALDIAKGRVPLVAGLGIGSLAFALAAQDSLANIFGAIVVAVDQPFRIGEVVKIGANVGAVEDIGLRSTRIRLVDKSLMTIPNKTVAAETITNLSRFTRRRFEQVISLTYGTKPDEMTAMVEEIRGIITSQPEVDAPGVMVFFRDFSASSLDIWIVYEIPSPDFQRAMRVKQRINLAIMRAVAARGLSFAFPTQTIELSGRIAERLAGNGETPRN